MERLEEEFEYSTGEREHPERPFYADVLDLPKANFYLLTKCMTLTQRARWFMLLAAWHDSDIKDEAHFVAEQEGVSDQAVEQSLLAGRKRALKKLEKNGVLVS